MGLFGSTMLPTPQVPPLQGLSVPPLNLPTASPQVQPQPSAPQPTPVQAAPAAQAPAQPVYPGLKRPPPPVGTTINGYTYLGGDPRSTDTKVWKPATGDAFLNSLPLDDTKKALVKAIATYDLPPGSGRGGIGSPEVQQVLGLVKQYDPTFDAKNYKARQDFIHDMNDGKTKDQIQNLTNAALHARDFDSAYSKLDNYNQPSAINKIENLAKGYIMRDPATLQNLGAANQAQAALAPESSRVYKGSEPTVDELNRQISNLDVNQAPAMESGQLGDMASKFAQRLLTIQDSYKRAFGNAPPPKALINPEAAQAVHELISKYKPGYDAGLDYNTLTAGGFSPQRARAMTGATTQQTTPANERSQPAPARTGSAPQGVDPNIWKHMTPQEQALWH